MTFEDIYELKTRNLVNVYRYSGKRLIVPESVPDHISDMTAIGIYLGNKMNEVKPFLVDIPQLVYKIAVHDYDECLMCDIPRDFKYHNPKLNKEINRTTRAIMEEEFSESFIYDIEHSKDKTIEGRMVSLLDATQSTLVLYREVFELGNRTLSKVLDGNIDYLKTIQLEFNKENLLPHEVIMKQYLETIINKVNNEIIKRNRIE